jgi:hypothetical protein
MRLGGTMSQTARILDRNRSGNWAHKRAVQKTPRTFYTAKRNKFVRLQSPRMSCLKPVVSQEVRRKESKNVERLAAEIVLTISWGVPACSAALRLVLWGTPWEVITTGNDDFSDR